MAENLLQLYQNPKIKKKLEELKCGHDLENCHLQSMNPSPSSRMVVRSCHHMGPSGVVLVY